MNQAVNQPSRLEKGIGMAVLCCLVVIAMCVFLRQFNFNPAVLVATETRPAQLPKTSPANELVSRLPRELKTFGAPESFTPDNLYDKIDGKAELYLASGFVRLNCQRFALKAAPDQWLEWSVYDMGTTPHAFSVFTVQRRPDGEPVDLTQYAYKSRNALFFVCGSNYVEAVASTTNPPLMQAMLALARSFVSANAPGSPHLTQLHLLPSDNLIPGSYVLQTADVFGFDRFKNVYTAQYKIGGVEVLGFVTTCSNTMAAAALRDAYRSFLVENGGKLLDARDGTNADQPVKIMDTIEVVFSDGNYVAGVHAAPDVQSAKTLAAAFHQHLAGILKP